MNPDLVTAAEMARERGIDPKRFRAALRAADLGWHVHGGGWTVQRDSSEHADLKRILASLGSANVRPADEKSSSSTGRMATRAKSDEAWVIDLCDRVLGQKACRQHRFPFLLGDAGLSGRRASLPVDAYYPGLQLVVEYHERQHTEPVAFFDRRQTVSGMTRGEQRRRYDNLRRQVLPDHGYRLEIIEWRDLAHSASGRLLRSQSDIEVIRKRLADLLEP